MKTNFNQFNKTYPQIGDYVICKEKNLDNIPKLKLFIENNIGQIVKISDSGTKRLFLYNIPSNLLKYFDYLDNDFDLNEEKNCRIMYLNEIVFFSHSKQKTLKELEIIITTKNFNL